MSGTKDALASADERAAAATLGGSTAPFLVGVRHHSPALAAALPAMLETFAPTAILLELPPDFAPWLPWLVRDDATMPLALAASTDEAGLAFYPYADFSPELAALRWAHARGVPVTAIDRPLRARVRSDEERPRRRAGPRLLASLEGDGDVEDLWDHLVESRAPASSAESLRRGALSFGFLLRADTLAAGRISPDDEARERHMRHHVQAAITRGDRVAVVIGAFHANALLAEPIAEAPPSPVPPKELAVPLATGSLVPYDFALFDSRSGYPAGIRDPALAQRLYDLARTGRSLADDLGSLLVEIARKMRQRGHVASFSDVREAARLCLDLATLRGLAAPGRRELLESVETAFGQGELLGRGRVLAAALEETLVGTSRGRLGAGTPRSGIALHVEGLLTELRLPGVEDVTRDARAGVDITLDPLRSPLDRRRSLALERLAVCGVPYAERREGVVAGLRGELERLTSRYRVRFTPETAARLELLAVFGITLEQAAEGTLRHELRRERREGRFVASTWLGGLRRACESGLPGLTRELLASATDDLLPSAGLPELTATLALLARIDAGAFPGLPREPTETSTTEPAVFDTPVAPLRNETLAAAVRALEGLGGTDRDVDVLALGELLSILGETQPLDELGGLAFLLETFARSGSPTMQGACLAALIGLGRRDPTDAFTTFVSWFDGGGDDLAAARARTGRLRGTMLLAGPIFEGHPGFAAAILGELDRLADTRFLARLPSLRGGFDVLSAGSRRRLLSALEDRVPGGAGLTEAQLELASSPQAMAARAIADEAARTWLETFGLWPKDALGAAPVLASEPSAGAVAPFVDRADHRLPLADRLRLLLGREREQLGAEGRRYARALDELYGRGHGEGAREEGGGVGGAFPTAREWADELGALFDHRVREEVLGRAAEGGNAAAALVLDPEDAHPSVELLTQVLSLAGGVGEGQLAGLRKLARRIVDALAKELATKVTPALGGLALPRSTRRPRGPLDLRTTIRRNLATARRDEAGVSTLAPSTLFFRSRSKRTVDWRVALVVDVSGSMEPSVIYSAIMASILAALPALTTSFYAFSDDVIDLTDRVHDPLELLLGVRVGGGTNIAKGLRAARKSLVNPTRSLVVVVSDFEEGGPLDALLAEIRALVDSGATVLGLASLDDAGAPRYHHANAERIAGAGMPVAALSPLELARWVGERVRRSNG